MGSFYTEKAPLLHTEPGRSDSTTTALPTPPVGVPASPWTWAKARSKLGALIRLSVRRRGGVKRGENGWGHFTRKSTPPAHRTGPFRLTHHRTPDAPRWRSRLALDVGEGQKQTRCIDSPVCAETGRCQTRRCNGVILLHGKKHPSCTQNRAIPTHHRATDAPRWRSRLALDGVTPPAHRTGLFRPTTALPTPPVGVPASPWTWAKARSKPGALIRLSVRRRGGVKRGENKWGHFTRGKAPLLHTEPGCYDPPPRYRRPPLAFPPRPGRGRRPEANQVH
jgi:hypothetical protein